MDESNGKYAPVPGKIPGTVLNLGGVTFVVAPFNLDAVKIVEPLLKKFADLKSVHEVIPAAAAIIHPALLRNNPDITIDEVTALLDMGNVNEAVYAVVNIGGFKPSAPGESAPATH